MFHIIEIGVCAKLGVKCTRKSQPATCLGDIDVKQSFYTVCSLTVVEMARPTLDTAIKGSCTISIVSKDAELVRQSVCRADKAPAHSI